MILTLSSYEQVRCLSFADGLFNRQGSEQGLFLLLALFSGLTQRYEATDQENCATASSHRYIAIMLIFIPL